MFNISDYLENVDREIKEVEKRIQLLNSVAETRSRIIICVKSVLNKTEEDCEVFSIDSKVIDYLQSTLEEVQNVDAKDATRNKLMRYHAKLCSVQDKLKETVENYERLNKLLKDLNSSNP